jgi:hypothetical protein
MKKMQNTLQVHTTVGYNKHFLHNPFYGKLCQYVNTIFMTLIDKGLFDPNVESIIVLVVVLITPLKKKKRS